MSVNKRYLPHIQEALFSLINNFPKHPDIHIICSDLPLQEAAFLRDFSSKITLHDNTLPAYLIGCRMQGVPEDIHMRSYYARFLIRASDMFEKYEHVLYLDTDLVVLSDLSEVFEKDEFVLIEESYRSPNGAIKEPISADVEWKLRADSLYENLFSGQWNSWVMLIPKTWRTKEQEELIAYLVQQYGEYSKCADQGIINLWRIRNNISLSQERRYNTILGGVPKKGELWAYVREHILQALSGTHIFHFAGDTASDKLLFQKTINKYGSLGKYMVGAFILGSKAPKGVCKYLLRSASTLPPTLSADLSGSSHPQTSTQ